jgi:ubiquinone/menaquinone biosynthesis C-methylase UbiE
MSFYEDHIFPPVMEWATKGFRRQIAALIAQAQGRVLEIGAGTGANLGYYSPAVEEIVGIEPVEAMLEKARRMADSASHGIPVRLTTGDARDLPFADAEFDTVVACLVFCTIPQPEKAAQEAFRVLKPGGKLVFFEHVASPHRTTRAVQNRLNPLWRKVACGCEINRDTRRLFEQAGFVYDSIDDFIHPKVPALVAPIITGIATRP